MPVWDELNASLEALRRRLSQALSHGQQIRRAELSRLLRSPALTDPQTVLFKARQDALYQLRQRLGAAIRRRQEDARRRLELARGMLRTLDPNGVVERGYIIATREGQIVTNVRELHPNDRIALRFSDGTARANIIDTNGEDAHDSQETDF